MGIQTVLVGDMHIRLARHVHCTHLQIYSCYYAVWCVQCGLFHNNKRLNTHTYTYFPFHSISPSYSHHSHFHILSFLSQNNKKFNHLVELFDLINDFGVKHSSHKQTNQNKIPSFSRARARSAWFLWVLIRLLLLLFVSIALLLLLWLDFYISIFFFIFLSVLKLSDVKLKRWQMI